MIGICQQYFGDELSRGRGFPEPLGNLWDYRNFLLTSKREPWFQEGHPN
jgi:hypothetical protein